MQIKVKKITALLFFLLLPCFKPTYFTSINIINKLYTIMMIISFITILFLYFIKRQKISKMSFLFITFEFWIILNTYFQGGDIKESIRNSINILIIILVLDFYSNNIKYIVNVLMVHFEICIYINLATMIIWPNGMYSQISDAYGITEEWFLGWDNNFIIWLFPAVCIAILFAIYNKKKIRSQILIYSIIFTILYSWVATAAVGVFAIILLMKLPCIEKIFTPVISFTCAFTIFILIVVVQNFDFLSPIIEGILHKDMTFNSRIGIWNNAMIAIKNRWLMGYGVLSHNDMINYLGWNTATHCHNHYLQILFQGGVISFINYLLIQVEAIKKLSINWKSPVAKVISYSIFAFNIMCITEPYNYALMYIVFILAEHNKILSVYS